MSIESGIVWRRTKPRAPVVCAVALTLLAVATSCSDRPTLTEPAAPTPRQPEITASFSTTTSPTSGVAEGPRVWTNKEDYVPGEMVLMLGTGFQPGETVTLTLSESAQLHADRSFSAIADSSGAFMFEDFRPEDHHVGVHFLLTATGQVSGLQAQWEFLDSIVPGSFQTNHNGDPAVAELTIARPTTTVAGTFLIAHVTVEGFGTTDVICTPAGWSTQMTPTISSGRTNNSSSVAQQVFWKVATGSEPASYTWRLRTNTTRCSSTSMGLVTGKGAVGGIIAYSGVDAGHADGPISHFVGGTGSANTINAPDIAGVPVGSRVVRYFGNDKEFEISTSGTGTARIYAARRNKSGGGFEKPSGAGTDGEQAATGTTQTVTGSNSGNGGNWVAQTVVLRMGAPAKSDQTITFVAPGPFTYGDAPFDPGATASSGLAVSYTSLTTGVCTVSGGNVTILAAGTCTIQATQAGNDSYNAAPSVTRDITIDPAPLTVKADDQTKTYGDVFTFTGAEFSITLGSLVGTDAISSVTLSSSGAAAGAGVGNHDITPSAALFGSGSASNYAITYAKGTLSVGPADLTATAADKTRIQGGANPAFTVTYSGFVNGEGPSVVVGVPNLSTTAGIASPPGDYPITWGNPVGISAANYTIATVNGKLTVTANAPPEITSIEAPLNPVQLGYSITAKVTFTDADVPESTPYQVTVDWGDGSSDQASGIAAPGTVNLSKTYSSPGVYRLTVTVSDKIPGTDTEYHEYVVIYDPSGGFVTGGGWIDSPAGAYVADPDLGGKATFGFVSRYQKGAKVPSGNTEFQFHAGAMNFKGTLMEWLVISGARAQYKGEGTINGTGRYSFLLSAIDGQVNGGGGTDKFRIKICNLDEPDCPVVYDNQMSSTDDAAPTTVLGGGSIVVHAK